MSIRDTYKTPDALWLPLCHEFQFSCDVTAQKSNHKTPFWFGPDHVREDYRDALQINWCQWAFERGVEPTFWMNPPYSAWLLRAFMAKACQESAKGATVVALVPPSTCSRWWHESVLPVITPKGDPIPVMLSADQFYGEGRGEMRYLAKRIQFVPPKGVRTSTNDRDSVIIVFRPEIAK